MIPINLRLVGPRDEAKRVIPIQLRLEGDRDEAMMVIPVNKLQLEGDRDVKWTFPINKFQLRCQLLMWLAMCRWKRTILSPSTGHRQLRIAVGLNPDF